ncbi:MAG: hypothetical protein GWN46_26750, partial [Gammaproteobacteria bacterium]|nr:hypothetical protein [Gammaproteobacteria bacterium]
RPQVARRALKRLAPRSAEFKAASELWDIAFFGPDAVDQPTLRAVEARRVEAAESLMLGRLLFLDG